MGMSFLPRRRDRLDQLRRATVLTAAGTLLAATGLLFGGGAAGADALCDQMRAQYGPNWPCISVPPPPTQELPQPTTALPGDQPSAGGPQAGANAGPGPGVGNGTPIVTVPGQPPQNAGPAAQNPQLPPGPTAPGGPPTVIVPLPTTDPPQQTPQLSGNEQQRQTSPPGSGAPATTDPSRPLPPNPAPATTDEPSTTPELWLLIAAVAAAAGVTGVRRTSTSTTRMPSGAVPASAAVPPTGGGAAKDGILPPQAEPPPADPPIEPPPADPVPTDPAPQPGTIGGGGGGGEYPPPAAPPIETVPQETPPQEPDPAPSEPTPSPGGAGTGGPEFTPAGFPIAIGVGIIAFLIVAGIFAELGAAAYTMPLKELEAEIRKRLDALHNLPDDVLAYLTKHLLRIIGELLAGGGFWGFNPGLPDRAAPPGTAPRPPALPGTRPPSAPLPPGRPLPPNAPIPRVPIAPGYDPDLPGPQTPETPPQPGDPDPTGPDQPVAPGDPAPEPETPNPEQPTNPGDLPNVEPETPETPSPGTSPNDPTAPPTEPTQPPAPWEAPETPPPDGVEEPEGPTPLPNIWNPPPPPGPDGDTVQYLFELISTWLGQIQQSLEPPNFDNDQPTDDELREGFRDVMEQAADNAMALALEVEKLVGGLSPMNLGTVAHLYFEEILRTDLAKDLQDWFGSEFSVYPEWSLPNNGAFVGRDILSGMLNLQQAIEKGTIRPDVIVTRIVNGVEEAFAVFDLKTGNADIRTAMEKRGQHRTRDRSGFDRDDLTGDIGDTRNSDSTSTNDRSAVIVGLSAGQWSSLATEAVGVLGDPWHVVGNGLEAAIIRSGIQWRAQIVTYRPTRYLESLCAYDGLLVRPLSRTLARGDLGDVSDSFRSPGQHPGAKELFTPDGLALWIQNVQRLVFERFAEPFEPFELLDFVESKTQALELTGRTLQLRTGLRILCGVRTTAESLADIDAVLADEEDKSVPVSSYFEELRPLVAASDRNATLGFMNQTRLRTLRETFNIPPHLIVDPPTYPTPPAVN